MRELLLDYALFAAV